MSLKDLTKDKHDLAENTPFMKAVFDGTMTQEAWADFTYHKHLIYDMIEIKAKDFGLLEGIEDIVRAPLLAQDAKAMLGDKVPTIRRPANEYYVYLRNVQDPKKLMAHLYVWHMGDLFGGQMIKQRVDAPHASLDFNNVAELKEKIRAKLDDSMAEEANRAFDWAIRILNSYKF